jgi:hypothetical protein
LQGKNTRKCRFFLIFTFILHIFTIPGAGIQRFGNGSLALGLLEEQISSDKKLLGARMSDSLMTLSLILAPKPQRTGPQTGSSTGITRSGRVRIPPLKCLFSAKKGEKKGKRVKKGLKKVDDYYSQGAWGVVVKKM